MGQYYKPYIKNDDGEFTFRAQDYGCGSKLMEHSWLGNEYVNAALTMIEETPSIVAWVGDYAIDECIEQSIYDKVWSIDVNKCLPELADIDVKLFFMFYDEIIGEGYLINHTKGEYISLKDYQEIASYDGWCVNPLPRLTAIGNGQGRGDYSGGFPNSHMVGCWALNKIEFNLKEYPSEYADITEIVVFKEVA